MMLTHARNRSRSLLRMGLVLGASALLVLGVPTAGLAQMGATVGTRDDPSLGALLTDSNGMTVYRFARDTAGAGMSACGAGCATAWPPVTVDGPPVAPDGLPGTLGTITRDDGSQQVTYNGQPLYRYASDQDASDAYGQGVGGVWYVVAPTAE